MNWRLFSKYRAPLMGLAGISIIIFHYSQMVGFHFSQADDFGILLYPVGRYGYMGVEIFLLLSGIGCYYSFSKNRDISLFYKKRFKKIIIPYLLIGLPFWLIVDWIIKGNQDLLLIDLLGISFFNGVDTFWYVFFILILYVVFPYIYFYFEDENKRNVRFLFLEFIIILITSIIHVQMNDLFQILEIMITRIPIYIFAIYIGKDVYDGKQINRLFMFVCILSLLFITVDYDNRLILRYMRTFQAIGFSLIIVKIFDIVSIEKLKTLSLFGDYSFEIYLCHMAIRRIFNLLKFPTYQLHIYLLVILLTMILSFFIKRITMLSYKYYF